MNKFIILILLIWSVTNAFSYSVYNSFLGSEAAIHDARSASLGGSGVAGGFTLLDSQLNPANTYFIPKRFTLEKPYYYGGQLNYALIKNTENRAIPLWNFFDSYIGENTYAHNENFYDEISFSLFLSYLYHQNQFSLTFTYRPVINFSANYQEQIRNDEDSNEDNFPPIIAKNSLELEGKLNASIINLNWGRPISQNITLSLGAGVAIYRGKYEYHRMINWTDVARDLSTAELFNLNEQEKRTIHGQGFHFGATSQLSERLRLGISYFPKTTLDFKNHQQSLSPYQENQNHYLLPARLRTGLVFQPRNPFKTNFQVDLEKNYYHDLSPFFEDSYAIYIGMEHYIGQSVPFRLGFSHRSAMQDKSLSLPVISTGTGFKITNLFYLDLAAEYGQREYYNPDLFPDDFYDQPGLWNSIKPTARDEGNPDKVTESFFKVFLSVSYSI